jgi:hypothetical protein
MNSDVALREGYQALLRMRQPKRMRRAEAILFAAKKPIRPWYELFRPICRSGAVVRDEYQISLQTQLTECRRLAQTIKVRPESYYTFRLFLPENQYRWSEYLYHEENTSILSALNKNAPTDTATLTNKKAFFIRARSAGLPVIPVLAEIQSRGAHQFSTVDHLEGLFSKPIDRWCGEGATIWRRAADGTYDGQGECGLSFDAVIMRLRRSAAVRGAIIVQPLLRNATDLLPVSGQALSTARLVTIRDLDGLVHVALAAYRIPVGSMPADNFALGGLAAPIDLDSGTLGCGIFKRPKRGRERVYHHPDTGAVIQGRTLPNWSDAKQLAIAAHTEFKSMVSVGWDIAFTDQGLILVEGNAVWCMELIQASHRAPLGRTPIAQILLDHLKYYYPDWVQAH